VVQASNEPNRGPDFAPASNDGVATAKAEERHAAHATQPAPTLEPYHDQRDAVDGTTGNAAAAPADRSSAPNNSGSSDSRSADTNAGKAAGSGSAAPDNTGVNTRDRSSAALTPMDQGSSAADRTITQQIRKELMNDKSLSFTAKNVKVITVNGKVTLRGPVKSEAERSAVEAAARRAAGDGSHVDSQLEIAK